MKEQISILIVEDDKKVANVLKEGLVNSEKYTFKPEIVLIQGNLTPLIKYSKKSFDFYIIDLKFEKGGTGLGSPSGFDVIRSMNPFLIQKGFDLMGTIIIYTVHPSFENAVKAMQLGVHHFISKLKCPPHLLVKKLEYMLDEEKKKIERSRKLDEMAEKHHEEWQKEYGGKIIAIVGDDIVASGETHLETMIEYNKLLADHEDWPEIPDLIEISREVG